MEAVILAGGLGTRLRAVVSDVPKPLAPVGGRPFLAWQLDLLAARGVHRVILATGHRSEQIVAALGHSWRGMSLEYEVETVPRGTGGALRGALRRVHGQTALVLNGDTYLDLDLEAFERTHVSLDAPVTVAVTSVPDASRYGTVVLDAGRIREFVAAGRGGPGLINAGAYLVQRDLLADRLAESFSFERDVLQHDLATLRPAAFLTTGLFIDIGVPDDYARAQNLFATGQP